MRTVGIIAEYNPLHHGHAWHIAQAKKAAGADYAVVVMSSAFTQRGEAAIVSPSDRARMALAAGADAVFALPVMWAVRDAEHFALGGVSILHSLGVEAISCGVEIAHLDGLKRALRLLDDPPESMQAALREALEMGVSYPTALHMAMKQTDLAASYLLTKPNCTLAVEYLRAMKRVGSQMEVYPIRRQGSYHTTTLGEEPMPSATAVRSAILRGDWQGAESAMPPEAFAILRSAAQQGRIHRPEALDTALLYRLRTMLDANKLPDVSEGIEMRLLWSARQCTSREAALQDAKTRRYTYARLSRLCAHALLGVTQDMVDAQPLPPAAWLLGLKKGSEPLMGKLAQSGFPIIAKAADYKQGGDWFEVEKRAYDLWALGVGEACGLALRQGVAR